jgi:tRNA(Ile)-lysidine synthase
MGDLTAIFVAAMDRLGPFETNPALAVAVSGGADSMALSILARDWARQRSGSLQALVVDHGLRAASGDEARTTIERLASLGISGRMFRLSELKHGSALAERARIMRYDILSHACTERGILHLLLGHHTADQAETLAMRVLRGSHIRGLAGMAALRETGGLRILRPLLGIEPQVLRHFLTACGTVWIEDPSNQDLQALRPRLRWGFASASARKTGLSDALSVIGLLRRRDEEEVAAELAQRATIRPEGFALLSPGRISALALGSLIQTLGGAPYTPSPAQINELASRPKSATVAGVCILPAGRFGDGMLLVREEAAIGNPTTASHGAIWDNRFRVFASDGAPGDALVTQMGADAARFRRCSELPSAVLRTLPTIRIGKVLAAVPHLGYSCQQHDVRVRMLFVPKRPAAGPGFVPAG